MLDGVWLAFACVHQIIVLLDGLLAMLGQSEIGFFFAATANSRAIWPFPFEKRSTRALAAARPSARKSRNSPVTPPRAAGPLLPLARFRWPLASSSGADECLVNALLV